MSRHRCHALGYTRTVVFSNPRVKFRRSTTALPENPSLPIKRRDAPQFFQPMKPSEIQQGSADLCDEWLSFIYPANLFLQAFPTQFHFYIFISHTFRL